MRRASGGVLLSVLSPLLLFACGAPEPVTPPPTAPVTSSAPDAETSSPAAPVEVVEAPAQPAAAAAEPLKVVATFSIIGDMAKQVGGDRIDLSAIDANSGVGGNQAFTIGAQAGQVRFVNNGANTEVLANTDGDSTPEVRIVIEDGARQASAYGAQDLVL